MDMYERIVECEGCECPRHEEINLTHLKKNTFKVKEGQFLMKSSICHFLKGSRQSGVEGE